MALRLGSEAIYREVFSEIEPGGRLMIFGRPTLLWDNAPSPEDFFKQFGFAEVHTLDVSPYQGASHIFDLNSPEPPAELVGKYRYVVSGGTLEHVFNIVNAVRTALALLEEGGTLSFAIPVNNWVDHGFYQISPTFAFDYFAENGLEFGVSIIGLQMQDGVRRSYSLFPGSGHVLNKLPGRATLTVKVRKTAGSTSNRTPIQSLYRPEGPRRFRFRAYEPNEIRGERVIPIERESFDLSNRAMQAAGDHYTVRFHRPQYLASLPGKPFRSRALVYEDGELLRWVVSAPEMVSERSGSYAHFSGTIFFTTSDGSDPRANGRRYTVEFPKFDPFAAVAAAKLG